LHKQSSQNFPFKLSEKKEAATKRLELLKQKDEEESSFLLNYPTLAPNLPD
jgi:hypothetical protein